MMDYNGAEATTGVSNGSRSEVEHVNPGHVSEMKMMTHQSRVQKDSGDIS